MRVIVIGAGPGGLTLAQGLRGAGIDVVVHERDGERGRPQGVSLHVDDRGWTALRACLPPAQAAMAEATAGGPRLRTLSVDERDGELVIVGAEPLSDAGPVRPGRQVHRPLLRAVLLAGLEGAVQFGSAFTEYEVAADGHVLARFADGSTETGDVLVGADGIGSAVRRQLLPDARVIDSGRRMVMGATPLRAVADTGLPELIGHNATAVRAGDTFVALGVLRFGEPPVAARDRWLPGLRSAAVDAAEDYVMWALPVTREQLGSTGAPEAVWSRARVLVAAQHPALRLVVDEAWPDTTVPLRIGVIPAVPPWPPGPVTVIGDAVHLAPGFGGNLAMRDAHRLRDALVRAARGEQDLATAIGAYEDTMRRESFPAVPRTVERTA